MITAHLGGKSVKIVEITIEAVVVVIFFLLNILGKSNAQEVHASNLGNLIQRLADDNIEIYIRFVTPLSEGDSSWTIPGDIVYGEEVVGTRALREVGDDYICVDNAGESHVSVYCVPFSNIEYVSYIEW